MCDEERVSPFDLMNKSSKCTRQNKMMNNVRKIQAFIKEVLLEYSRNKGSLFAAATSFYGLISLVPLLLLGISVFGHLVGSEAARREVTDAVRQFIPVGTHELEVRLAELSKQSRIFGGLGIIALAWAASQVFAILHQVINIAFEVEEGPGLIRTKIVSFAMLLFAGLLFGLSIGVTTLLTAVRRFDISIWGLTSQSLDPIWGLASVTLTFLLSVLAFILIYRFLPGGNVGRLGPVVGGIAAGVLFEFAKYAFRWYVTNIANYNAVYGSLGSIVALVLWIYYVAVITVLCAEVASVYSRYEREH